MLRPLKDFVLIRRDKHEGKIGLIVVPENAREELTRGVVVAVGPGKRQSCALADRLEKALGKGILSPRDRELFAVVELLRLEAPTLKVGDKVLFGKYSGNPALVKLEGEEVECQLIREEEIYGVIEP